MKITLQIILFISILFSNVFSIHSQVQKTGMFAETVNFGSKQGLIHFYVPEDYDSTMSYPLVMGMSPGGGPGIQMLGMIMPFASERKIILACPDPVVATLELLDTVRAYTCRNFNIDESNVICTGYSAGSAATVPYTENRPKTIRGVIGIATSIFMQNFLLCNNRAFAFIAGKLDGAWGSSLSLAREIIKAGGVAMVIAKEGIGHFDPYYGSPEFLEDFKTCYDFIQDYKPVNKVNLVSPVDSAQDLDDPIILTWNKKPQAEIYEVRLHMATYILKTEQTTDTTHVFDSLMSNTEYSWTVRYISGTDTGSWADIRYFKTKLKAPALPPDIIMPNNGATNIHPKIYLRWDSSPEAEFYHIQISKDNFETTFVDDSTYPTVMYSHENSPWEHKATYYWRVRAGNSLGWGPWTDIYTFTCIDPTVSVYDIRNNDVFHSQVVPNPVIDKFNIIFEMKESGKAKINIFDINGRLIGLLYNKELSAGEYDINVDSYGLANGVYFYGLNVNGKVEFRKFEIRR